MSQYISKHDKELARAYINDFVNTNHKMSILRYKRLVSWLEGMTYSDIGDEEHVSGQAVAQSIKGTVESVIAFAKNQPNKYTANSTSIKKGKHDAE